MSYEVVYCSDCKKPIKTAPSWLAGVDVRFTCEQCRQKHSRGPVGFEPGGGRLVAVADIESDDPIVDAVSPEEPGEPIDEELEDDASAAALEE